MLIQIIKNQISKKNIALRLLSLIKLNFIIIIIITLLLIRPVLSHHVGRTDQPTLSKTFKLINLLIKKKTNLDTHI